MGVRGNGTWRLVTVGRGARGAWIRAICVGLWVAVAGLAQGGVAVSPLKQELTVKPGETGKATITLTNQCRTPYDGPQSVHLSIVDVQVMDSGAISFPSPATMNNSASKWATLGREQAVLEPNQSQAIECTLKPSLSVPPGEYYVAVMVTMDSTGRSENGVVVQYRIASGVFVTVSGRMYPKEAKIERCALVWPEADAAADSQPAANAPASQPAPMPKVCVLLHNTGKARFEGSGKVQIMDGRSRVVFSGALSSQRPCVFGGDSRLFEAPVDKLLPAGRYTLKAEMDYGSSWGKARCKMPLEIGVEQAERLAMLNRRYKGGDAAVEVTPEKVSLTVQRGAMRSLGLRLRNASDAPLRGHVALASLDGSSSDSWITTESSEFAIAPAERKTLGLRVQVPPGAPRGTYHCCAILRAGPEGTAVLPERRVPVDIEVKAER